MSISNKIIQNAETIFLSLSFNEPVSIQKEIFFSEASILALKALLKNKSPLINKYLKNKEIVSALNHLKKAGSITENEEYWIFKARKTRNNADEENTAINLYLQFVLPNNPENNASWPIFAGLESLVTIYIKAFKYSETFIQHHRVICTRFIEYLIYTGEYTKGLKIIKEINSGLSAIPDNFSFKAQLSGYKAEIYRMKGKNRIAINLLRPIINRMEKQANKHQLLLANLYTVLGLVLLYDDNLQFTEAQNYLQRALLIRQINLGNNHHLTLSSQLNMAHYFIQLGKGVQAIEHINKILKYFKPDSNEYFNASVNDALGLASFYKGDRINAMRYFENGLITRQKILKKNHSLRIESLHNVGYLLILTSNPQEARGYLCQTYSVFKKIYTPEHQNYLITVGANAICNLALNKIDEAEEILLKEVKRIIAYPRASYNLYTIAIDLLTDHFQTVRKMSKVKQLMEINIKMLNSRAIKYDRKYRNILNSYLKILKAGVEIKKMLWVKKELSEFLYIELQQQIKESSSPSLILNNYGMRFKNSLNDYARAEECYKKTLELNPTYGSANNNYALLLTSVMKDDDKAEQYYLKALELDCNDPVFLGNYAFFLQNARNKITEAELCYQESLQINSKEKSNLANYASLKLIQGNIEESKELASKSLMLCIPNPSRFTARPLFILTVIRMFECKNYDDLLGNMKFLFEYGIEHVPWDNRSLLAFSKIVLQNAEYWLLQKIFNTINEYTCIKQLNEMSEWKAVNSIPFVNAYKSEMR